MQPKLPRNKRSQVRIEFRGFPGLDIRRKQSCRCQWFLLYGIGSEEKNADTKVYREDSVLQPLTALSGFIAQQELSAPRKKFFYCDKSLHSWRDEQGRL